MKNANPFHVNVPQEVAMVRFVHPDYVAAVTPQRSYTPVTGGHDGASALAGALLALAVGALLLLVYQLIDAWTSGHMLLVWVALWTLAFTALAMLAAPMRRFFSAFAAALVRWNGERRLARRDAALSAAVGGDARVLTELRLVRTHSQLV